MFSVLTSSWLVALVAAVTVLVVGGRAFTSSFEHAGFVLTDPTALADQMPETTPAVPSSGGPIESGHHHHLADLALPPFALLVKPPVASVSHRPAPDALAPEAPIAGIDYPPQLS